MSTFHLRIGLPKKTKQKTDVFYTTYEWLSVVTSETDGRPSHITPIVRKDSLLHWKSSWLIYVASSGRSSLLSHLSCPVPRPTPVSIDRHYAYIMKWRRPRHTRCSQRRVGFSGIEGKWKRCWETLPGLQVQWFFCQTGHWLNGSIVF